MIDFKFHSIADIRKGNNAGATLIGVLAKLYPDTFSDFYMVVASHLPCEDEFSGMLVQYSDGKVVCIVVVNRGATIDRVFTLPTYRRRGHMRCLLMILRGISMIQDFTFTSPVDVSAVSVFEKAGWVKYRADKLNPDGTIDLVSNDTFKGIVAEYEVPNWFDILTDKRIQF